MNDLNGHPYILTVLMVCQTDYMHKFHFIFHLTSVSLYCVCRVFMSS